MADNKPKYLTPIAKNIPQPIKDLKKWVVWKGIIKDEKYTKEPFNPHNKRKAKTNNPKSWSKFEAALNCFKTSNGFDGIGYVLTKDDPFVGWDLDKCRDPETGEIKAWAQKIINRMNSYSEISPSGTGVRIFAKGSLPKTGRKKGKIEIYETGRYLTLTGHHLPGTPTEIIERHDETMELHSEIFKSEKTVTVRGQPAIEPTFLDDKALLQKAFESKIGDKIRQLYTGDTSGYSSQSEADQALCDHLAFWFGKDPKRMDAVFRSSGLFRKKWDEKHYADGRTYGEGTINEAIRFTTATYQGKPGKPGNRLNIDETALDKRVKEILDSKKPCGTFDTSKLPSILEDYIQSICSETQAEPIIIVQSVLCCASAMLGRRICMPQNEYFQNLYPNLWTLTISPSGSFKTTALNKGSAIALKKQSEILIKIDDLNLKMYELKSDIIDPKSNERTIREKEIKKLEKQADELSKNNPVLPNRSTAEGLMVLLGDSSGRIEHPGGMVVCSEFGEWAQNLDRSHNLGYKALLTDLFDIPPVWKYLTKGGGMLIIRNPFITINAVSTLPWVEKNIKPDDVSGGFFARFLLFYPPQETQIPPALPTKYRSRDRSVESNIRDILNTKKEKKYMLSPSAREVFEKIHSQLYKIISEQPNKTQEILGPYLKRWSPYILKIAMLLQVIDDPKADKILHGAIVGATSVVNYAINSTIYLFKNELGESEQQRKQRKILEYIANRKGKVKRSQLVGSRVLDGGAKDYDYVLESLEAAGQIEVDTSAANKTGWIYVLTHEKG